MKTYLDPSEISLLEKAASNLRDQLLIRVLFYIGCRITEALGVTVWDVDFSHGTVTIQHLKARLKLSRSGCGQRISKCHTFCPKCGQKLGEIISQEQKQRRQRVLPVDNDTLKMLKEYIERDGPVVRDGKRLIFGINRHRAWQIVKECAERAGLPKLLNPETGRVHNVSPHRLRDALAVHAVKLNDSGDGLRLLQEHLGHQSITTTMRYRKVAGEEHMDWYRRLWEKDKP